jgi:hypothetical protein
MSARPKATVRFLRFHRENTHVYRLFEGFTREMVGALGKPIAMMLVLQRTRWEYIIDTTGDDFRLNNNYAPFYARLLMYRCPDLIGAFNLRRSVADDASLFDPDQLPLWESAHDDTWLEEAARAIEA